MSNLVDKATMLQVITCLDSLLDRANHDEYLTRIGKKEALKFLEENEKYANIIKSSLQRLEAVDNANPSEALEKLLDGYSKGIAGRSYYDAIKSVLLKEQEQEKVLEIIKEKNVDIIYLKDSNTVEEYNSHFGCVVCKLTQEEFELLKRHCNE